MLVIITIDIIYEVGISLAYKYLWNWIFQFYDYNNDFQISDRLLYNKSHFLYQLQMYSILCIYAHQFCDPNLVKDTSDDGGRKKR